MAKFAQDVQAKENAKKAARWAARTAEYVARNLSEETEETLDEEEEDQTQDTAEDVTSNLQASNMQWFQPLPAASYSGVRRFGAGDQVQGWVVRDGEATKSGEVVSLMGAARIVTASAAILVCTFI